MISMQQRLKEVLRKLSGHTGFRRYFLNTSWMFAEQLLRIFSGLFVGIYVARYLGPEKFGIFSYAASFAALFTAVARVGLDGLMVRELVNHPLARDTYLGTAFWLKLTGAMIAIGLMAIAIHFTNNDIITNIYIFIIASGLILQAFDVIDFYFQSKVLLKYVSICRLVQLALSSILKLYLIFIQADLIWFVIVSLIDQLSLSLFLIYAYSRQKLANFLWHFDIEIARELLRNSWPLILSGIAVSFYMKIDQVMIKEMLGEREVGLYSAAVKLSEAWYFVPAIIATSLFPSILNAKKDNKDLYLKRLRRLYVFMVYLAAVIALPVTFIGNWIIDTMYGVDYYSAGLVLSIHIWAGIFVGLGIANHSWFLAENLQKIATINTIIGAATNIILNYFLIPVYGIFGAAFATLVSYGVSAYMTLYLHNQTRNRFYEITSSIIPNRRWFDAKS